MKKDVDNVGKMPYINKGRIRVYDNTEYREMFLARSMGQMTKREIEELERMERRKGRYKYERIKDV